jgi:hypothetical protein
LLKKLPQKKYLADAARLDLIRFDLFHLQITPTTKNILQKKVKLHGARLWRSNYTLFSRARHDRLQPVSGKPRKSAQYAIVYRKAFAVCTQVLTPAQYNFAQALTKGARIARLLQEAEQRGSMTAHETRRLFAVLGLEGVLI